MNRVCILRCFLPVLLRVSVTASHILPTSVFLNCYSPYIYFLPISAFHLDCSFYPFLGCVGCGCKFLQFFRGSEKLTSYLQVVALKDIFKLLLREENFMALS